MKLPLLLALLLLPSIALARIGETPEQCATRYGKPTVTHAGEDSQTIAYGKGPLEITAWFHAGRCTAIHFVLMRASRVTLATSTFTPAQVERILDANSSGAAKWEKSRVESYVTEYSSADGLRRAQVLSDAVTIQLAADIARREKLLTPEAISSAIDGL